MKKLVPFLVLGVFAWYVVAGIVRAAAPSGDAGVVAVGRLPVVANGRVQPFDSVGRNALLQIRSTTSVPVETGGGWSIWRRPEKLGATDWLLETMTRPDLADARKIFLVHSPELLGELGLEPQSGSGLSYYSFRELAPKIEEIETQAKRIDQVEAGRRTAAERQLAKLYNAVLVYWRLKNSLQPNGVLQRQAAGRDPRFDFAASLERFRTALPAGAAQLAAMRRGDDMDEATIRPVLTYLQAFRTVADQALALLVPPSDPTTDRDDWRDIGTSLAGSLEHAEVDPAVVHWAAIATASANGDGAGLERAASGYRAWLTAAGFDRELRKGALEHFFNHSRLFVMATAIYLVTLLFGCAFWLGRSPTMYRSAVLLAAVAVVLHTGGLGLRMILEGRPPVTNLYSSAVFVGWGAVVLGLVVERFWRNGIGLVAAAFVGFATQIIAHNLALGGDTMQMMQAVLDNNFWLSTHVVIITLGYSAMLVAGFMAAFYVVAGVLTPWLSTGTRRSLEKMVYGIVCFATLFSFVGTVLGGIWADQSWGRFWGWDPKENGALMIVLWSAIWLHVRWGGLVDKTRLMALAVGGNIVTSFSWFGVNMLGVGLHSYGFMNSAFRWLVLFVAVQILIIGLGLLPARLWRSIGAAAASGRSITRADAPPAAFVRPNPSPRPIQRFAFRVWSLLSGPSAGNNRP